MFHVGGIAALTLIINATTSARLLKFLGLTSEPEERERLLRHIERHLSEQTTSSFQEMVQSDSPSPGAGQLDSKLDLRFKGADAEIVRSMVPSLQHTDKSHPKAPTQYTTAASPTIDESRNARCSQYREVLLQVVQNHY